MSATTVARPPSVKAKRAARAVLRGYLPLVPAVLFVVLPLLWMVLSSFKDRPELISNPIQWLPHHLYLDNYLDAARKVPFVRNFANSLLVTAVGAGLKVVFAILSAYALVFVRFPFKRVIFVLILGTLMIPGEIAMVPNYTLVAKLGGVDTYWGIILPGLGSGMGTFLLRQQFLTIPAGIIESAKIDGAGHWRRLWRIVTPISAPTVATVALVSIIYEWNSYLWPLIITNDPMKMTLPVGLTLLHSTASGGGATEWGVMMAGSTIVLIPILIIFALLQRHIVEGLSQGAVKG